MALSKPSAALDRSVEPALTASGTGSMPVDAVYEILLRVPAKDLCRFRAVSRPWQSLLSDPHFIAAHAAYHPGPLIVGRIYASRPKHGILCDIMDLSGRVVKRVRPTSAKNEFVVFNHLDLICIREGNSESFRILNPANRAVYALPEGLAEGYAKLDRGDYRVQTTVFGLVASAGEYKVFRVLIHLINIQQWCEVFTLNGSSHCRWRANGHPTNLIYPRSGTVINGIVYFFSIYGLLPDDDPAPHCIDSFDLETEEWRETLHGPQINHVGDGIDYGANLSMAAVSGSLVVVHCFPSSMDLWFLTDFDKGLWVKQHSIQINIPLHHALFDIHPLLVLNDGRIITYTGTRGLLRIYNPRTSTYTDVAEIGPRLGIGLYTGNLLSLAKGAS